MPGGTRSFQKLVDASVFATFSIVLFSSPDHETPRVILEYLFINEIPSHSSTYTGYSMNSTTTYIITTTCSFPKAPESVILVFWTKMLQLKSNCFLNVAT